MQRQPDCVVLRDDDDRTPLLLAAAAGDAPTCTLLVRRMAAYDPDAINWADAGGLTPLHWALTQQRCARNTRPESNIISARNRHNYLLGRPSLAATTL